MHRGRARAGERETVDTHLTGEWQGCGRAFRRARRLSRRARTARRSGSTSSRPTDWATCTRRRPARRTLPTPCATLRRNAGVAPALPDCSTLRRVLGTAWSRASGVHMAPTHLIRSTGASWSSRSASRRDDRALTRTDAPLPSKLTASQSEPAARCTRPAQSGATVRGSEDGRGRLPAVANDDA